MSAEKGLLHSIITSTLICNREIWSAVVRSHAWVDGWCYQKDKRKGHMRISITDDEKGESFILLQEESTYNIREEMRTIWKSQNLQVDDARILWSRKTWISDGTPKGITTSHSHWITSRSSSWRQKLFATLELHTWEKEVIYSKKEAKVKGGEDHNDEEFSSPKFLVKFPKVDFSFRDNVSLSLSLFSAINNK